MLSVSKEIADQFINGDNRRVIVTINRDIEFRAALMPDKGSFFIMLNKELLKKTGLGLGDEVSVELQKDESKYGMDVPPELEELLIQDPEGDKVFHSLTPGKQRSLIYIVAKPKGSDIRLKKAITMINYLKQVNGKLDYKELNEAFKQSNRM